MAGVVLPLAGAWILRGLGSTGIISGAVAGWLTASILIRMGTNPALHSRLSARSGAVYVAWVRFTAVFVRLSRPLLRLRPTPPAEHGSSGLIRAESRAAPAAGDLGPEERGLFRRLLASTAILVSDIMTRWPRVVVVEDTASPEAASARFRESGHSRLPVLRGENVVGLVRVKDNLGASGQVADFMGPVHFVRQEAIVQDVFDEMRDAGVHLAVVLDRLGRSVGLVTVEDILEEIVGELHDEREAPGEESP